MDKYLYSLEMKVRDYECDLQGIVNNANYQHFYEHTRHEFLQSHGISFAQWHADGIDFVVARLKMAFKAPLHSGERFMSVLNMNQEGVKYVFDQKIFRLPDMQLCNEAHFVTVILDHGRLGRNAFFDDFVQQVNASQK